MEEEGDESKDLDTTSGAEPAPLAGQDAAQTDPQQDKASRQKEFWPELLRAKKNSGLWNSRTRLSHLRGLSCEIFCSIF